MLKNLSSEDKGAMIAAAAIMAAVAVGYFLMPPLMTMLAAISPILAFVAATAISVSFFGVFWLRARYKQRQNLSRKSATKQGEADQ